MATVQYMDGSAMSEMMAEIRGNKTHENFYDSYGTPHVLNMRSW